MTIQKFCFAASSYTLSSLDIPCNRKCEHENTSLRQEATPLQEMSTRTGTRARITEDDAVVITLTLAARAVLSHVIQKENFLHT